jgi:signal transduction histidine kinase
VLLWLAVMLAPLTAPAAIIITNLNQTNLTESYQMEPYASPTNDLGSWIWTDTLYDRQTCQFWRSFYIPENSKVVKARLAMTVDNEFTLMLDGREMGRGDEWRELFLFDLAKLLTPGQHTLAVKAFNSLSSAGMLLGFRIEFADGRVIEIKSDHSWRIVPDGASHWQTRVKAPKDWMPATIVAPLFSAPWWTTPQNVDVMPVLEPIHLLFWQTGWFQITLLLVCGVVIVISLRLMAQLALHRKERWLLQRERARIAREIHDDIGARMTQLVLHGELAQNGLAAGSEVHSQLVQLCEGARGLLSTMDEILWAMNPKRDTLRDFASYVCNYTQEFLAPTPIQCRFEVDSEMSAAVFNLPLRRSLLMAIKETLNNAVKYSEATELRLQIKWQGQRLVTVVQDNGKGFDQAIIKPDRNGLTNLAQRMQELGGTCVITSRPGQGCRVEFSIPLKQPRRHPWAWLWNPKAFSERLTRRASADDPSQNHDPTKS